MSWDILNESHPVARKQHQCDECGITVLPGEKYHRIEGKYDGNDWSTNKQCLPCEAAATWLFNAMSDAGCWPDECSYAIGDLYATIIDEARENKSFAGYRHAIGIKKRNRATRDHDGQAK